MSDLARPDTQINVVSVPDAEFIYNYTVTNPNTTAFGVAFTFNPNPTLGRPNLAYQVWYNYSLLNNGSDVYSRPMLALFRGLDEAILSYYQDPTGNTDTTLDITVKDWPLVPPTSLPDNIISSLGPTFFFAAAVVIFINLLNTIVTEKEYKLRHGMEMMGLKSSAYW